MFIKTKKKQKHRANQQMPTWPVIGFHVSPSVAKVALYTTRHKELAASGAMSGNYTKLTVKMRCRTYPFSPSTHADLFPRNQTETLYEGIVIKLNYANKKLRVPSCTAFICQLLYVQRVQTDVAILSISNDNDINCYSVPVISA